MRAAICAVLGAVLLLLAGQASAQGHAGPIGALSSGPDALLSGGFDGRVILWDARGQSARRVLRFHDGTVTAVALRTDGGLVTGGQDGRIAVWDADGQEPRLATPHGQTPVSALAVMGDRIAAGFWDGGLLVIDAGNGAQVRAQAHAGRVSGLAFLATGDLVSVGADLRFQRLGADLSPRASTGLPGLPNGMARVGERLAVIFAEGALRLFSADGALLPERFLSERPLVALAATSDTVAAAAVDGAIWLLEPDSLNRRAEIAGGNGPVWALALSGDTLFAAGAQGTIRRHAVRDGAPLGPDVAAQADPHDDGSRGAQVWRACAVCHSLEPGDHSRAGPSLHGVFGRAIASAEGYAFSPALRALDIVWTPETVAALFEVGPEVYTPGSRMPDQRVADPADRQALVEFIARASR